MNKNEDERKQRQEVTACNQPQNMLAASNQSGSAFGSSTTFLHKVDDELVPGADDVSIETSILTGDSSLCTYASDSDSDSVGEDSEEVAKQENQVTSSSFAALRFSYLLVTLVIMLADGLQGKRRLLASVSLQFTLLF